MNEEQQTVEEPQPLRKFMVELDENEMELLARQVKGQIKFSQKVVFKKADADADQETQEAIAYHEEFLVLLREVEQKFGEHGFPETLESKTES